MILRFSMGLGIVDWRLLEVTVVWEPRNKVGTAKEEMELGSLGRDMHRLSKSRIHPILIIQESNGCENWGFRLALEGEH